MELPLPDEATTLELARRMSGGHPVGDAIGQRDVEIAANTPIPEPVPVEPEAEADAAEESFEEDMAKAEEAEEIKLEEEK